MVEEQHEDREAQREVTIISSAVEIVPSEVAKEAMGRASTFSARITMEVLRHYGIKVRAIPTTVMGFNAAFNKALGKHGRLPASKTELELWRQDFGAAAIGVFEALPQVVVVTHVGQDDSHDGVMVDTALDQLSAPSRGVALEPLVATAPQGFLTGHPLLAKLPHAFARYIRVDNDAWVNSPGWRDADLRHHPIQRTIAKIDLKLHGRDLW